MGLVFFSSEFGIFLSQHVFIPNWILTVLGIICLIVFILMAIDVNKRV